jgi:serine/threonine protein kinase
MSTSLRQTKVAGLELIKLSQFWSYDIASVEDEEQARRRFTELFRTDVDAGKGGSGQVVQVKNALGEIFALKTPYLDVSSSLSEEEVVRAKNARIEAFKQEYKNQATFCRARNFPKLYGLGQIGNTPCMLMEWIGGGTITEAKELKADDPNHRKVNPFIVAKIGIQLLEMIENLQYADESFVHRDISASNIMFRISDKSIEQQLREQKFDLCLIDFGSSHVSHDLKNPSFTQFKGLRRGATPEYAAPEMLTTDIENVDALRRSVKIDSYAICSVLYELLCGKTPYDLKHSKVQSDSYYRHKLDNKIAMPLTLHAGANDSNSKARCKVDAQLGLILLKGLHPLQQERVTPHELKLMLQQFISNYEVNVQNALADNPLLPFIAIDAEVQSQVKEPVVLKRAVEDPTHFVVGESFKLNPQAQLLFEKEKKKIAFSKGIFAFGFCLDTAIAAIVSFCLSGSLYSSATSTEVVTISFAPLFVMLLAPIVVSALAFLIMPKKGADIAIGTAAIIALTAFTRSLTSDWSFVSEYVDPILVISQVCLAVIFTITICACRRQV